MNSTTMSSTVEPELILAAGGLKGFAIEAIGFVILVYVIGRYILPFAAKAMSARQATIAKQLADSEAAQQKLAEAQAAYDNAVAEARAEAELLRADARAQHEAIVSEAAAAAQARADEITTRAREQLEAERVTAVRALQAEVAGLAASLAERHVREALLDDARQRRVTERFMAELESGTVTGADPAEVAGTRGRSA